MHAQKGGEKKKKKPDFQEKGTPPREERVGWNLKYREHGKVPTALGPYRTESGLLDGQNTHAHTHTLRDNCQQRRLTVLLWNTSVVKHRQQRTRMTLGHQDTSASHILEQWS